jgi:hypothetical protein
MDKIYIFDIEWKFCGMDGAEAYVRASRGVYSLTVWPYRVEDGSALYPVMQAVSIHLEPFKRFNSKRLAAIAADPAIRERAEEILRVKEQKWLNAQAA